MGRMLETTSERAVPDPDFLGRRGEGISFGWGVAIPEFSGMGGGGEGCEILLWEGEAEGG